MPVGCATATVGMPLPFAIAASLRLVTAVMGPPPSLALTHYDARDAPLASVFCNAKLSHITFM